MVERLKTEPDLSLEPVIDIPIRGGAAAKAKMANVINEMCQSEAGRLILENAADNGYELKFDKKLAKDGMYGYADPCEESCVLNDKNTLSQNIITLAHELRHAYQFSFSDLDDLEYSECNTKAMMLKNRTMEADAECYACTVAWELKEQGKEACWQEMSVEAPEITSAFEKAILETGDINKAKTEAFKGWYDNAERRDSYDETLVSSIEGVSPEVFKKKLKSVSAAKFTNAYCSDLETGESYFTDKPSILESGKYTALYEDQKERLIAHHQKREALPDRVADKTIAAFESQPRPEAEKTNAHAVSDAARTIALNERQSRAAAKIKAWRASHNTPAVSLLQLKGNSR